MTMLLSQTETFVRAELDKRAFPGVLRPSPAGQGMSAHVLVRLCVGLSFETYHGASNFMHTSQKGASTKTAALRDPSNLQQFVLDMEVCWEASEQQIRADARSGLTGCCQEHT